MIYTIKSPNTGERFEWHPESKKVFRLIQNGDVIHGEVIAVDIDNHGAAITATLIWSRGYSAGKQTHQLNLNGVLQ